VKKRHFLVLLTLVLAGCGVGTPPPMTPYPLPSTTPPATASESPVPNSSGLPRPNSASPKPQAEITVVGTVEEGVEHGCTILRSGEALYQLMGSTDPLIMIGARISVTGKTNPGLVTTCQQGTPLLVIAVRPA
jgi:hypothetical protein